MKLLMHICCANCSLYPLQNLFSNGIDVKGLWLNPNIHPYTEYQKRLESLENLQKIWGLDIEYIDHYGLTDFLRTVVNREDNRCILCYSMRLDETAKTAKKMGLDGFTTSLLVSPYQKFDILTSVGKESEKKYSIPFYCEDFRHGWKDGIILSRKLGLYRQKYCGCIYSEMERYLKTESRN
ncbi:MAG: epoxyqueuosine reductase QueH [Nitrospirota bacterium]|nr:epoxyqueuosine reductase QueH [Nitrospirota bacterium]MDH5767605.1 epoxyqueuosine reductase QueH [Nitrospirota bacterium]